MIRYGSFYLFFFSLLTTDHGRHSTGREYLACPISRRYANSADARACRKTRARIPATVSTTLARESGHRRMAPISNRSSRANHPYFTDTRVHAHAATHAIETTVVPMEREFTIIIDDMTVRFYVAPAWRLLAKILNSQSNEFVA